MMQGRVCIRMRITSQPSFNGFVFYSYCRSGTWILCDLLFLTFPLWVLLRISQDDGSKHLSSFFGCLEAARNTHHLFNSSIFIAWAFFDATQLFDLIWMYKEDIQFSFFGVGKFSLRSKKKGPASIQNTPVDQYGGRTCNCIFEFNFLLISFSYRTQF